MTVNAGTNNRQRSRRGWYRRSYPISLLLLVGLFAFVQRLRASPNIRNAREIPPVERVLASAQALGLWKTRQWMALGRWQKNLGGGLQSQADGPRFFLSKQGGNSPKSELLATIHAFFEPASLGENHALCRFPARLRFLRERILLRLEELPQVSCPKLDRWRVSLEASSVTVVFSSYYMSSAASAFGHTLLRLDKPGVDDVVHQSLLDTGINFAAAVDTGNALIYAIKGLAGMFHGEFLRMPYYYKVREYNDYESRDLWEYHLNLNPNEVAMLVDHIWEMGSTWFDYYYLSENCSYHLLSVLEAAAPRLDLLGELSYPVIPADTIKVLFENEALVKSIAYRPSLRTILAFRNKDLGKSAQEWLLRLVKKPDAPAPQDLSPKQQGQVLDAAQDILDARYGDDIVFKPNAPVHTLKHELSVRRAGLGIVSEELRVPTPWSKAPHRGHDSRKLAMSSGVRDGEFISQLGVRLALHDLSDPPDGYPELSQIEFLPTLISFDANQHVALEEMNLVRIYNLPRYVRIDPKVSWKLAAGMFRSAFCDYCAGVGGEFGAGATLATEGEGFAIYGMATTRMGFFPDLHSTITESGLVEVGAEAGLRWRLHASLITLIRGAISTTWVSSLEEAWFGDATLRWRVHQRFTLDSQAMWARDRTQGVLGLSLFF